MALPNFSFLFRGGDGDDSGARRPERVRNRTRTTEAESDASQGLTGNNSSTKEKPSETRTVRADSPNKTTGHSVKGLSDNLLVRLRARDDSAYAELVEQLGPKLISFAAQRLHSDEAAQDIVQDVFYQIWQQGEHFEPRGPLVAYLFAAVRNRALNILKHDRIVQRSQGVLLASTDAGVTPRESGADAQMEAAEDVLRLRRALAQLTEHQRTAFALRYNQELTIAEIATVLGISEKGAERLMTRVRQLLRDYFLQGKRPPSLS